MERGMGMTAPCWIAILALACIGAQPVAVRAQTVPAEKERGTDSGPRAKPPGERRAVQCTDAAPCATPRTNATPGKIGPSAVAVREFREKHPCPTSGHSWGACPGYVVNHIKTPCKGGLDVPANLQWQTHTEANRRDQTACR
jgi:hypothetical protein